MTSTLRPPVKWHGGKHYLARRICELFGGAASVLLNKDPVSGDYSKVTGRIE